MKTAAASALFLLAVASIAAQSPSGTTPSQPPRFAVASIKLGAPPDGGPFFFNFGSKPGGQWVGTNVTFVVLLRSAYPAFSLPGQLVGGPAWITTQRFDVEARAEGDPPRDVMTEMLKQLLADRFQLKVHTEQRDVDVYALVLARADGRLGPGLRKAAVDCQAIAEARKKAAAAGAPPAQMAPPKPGERPQCGMMSSSMNGVMKLLTGGTAISAAAPVIQSTVGRPVVDRTGLTGQFDIDLEYAGTTQLNANPDQPNAPASVFTAVQEQLGLKLESKKEKMEVLVIDQVEMPTPN